MRKNRRPEWKRDKPKPAGGWRPREDDRRDWSDRPPRRDFRREDDRADTRRPDRPRSGGAKPWGKKPGG